jgi:YgiT-type zinc finger domain-containing protein
MFEITICPSCGSNKIKTVRRNWTDEFQGQTFTVPNLKFHECPEWGEKMYDREAMRKIEAHSPAFARTRRRKQGRAA